jgi:hypothetical protein
MAVPFTVVGIDHVVPRAADPKVLERFYLDALGLRFERREGKLAPLRAGGGVDQGRKGSVDRNCNQQVQIGHRWSRRCPKDKNGVRRPRNNDESSHCKRAKCPIHALVHNFCCNFSCRCIRLSASLVLPDAPRSPCVDAGPRHSLVIVSGISR